MPAPTEADILAHPPFPTRIRAACTKVLGELLAFSGRAYNARMPTFSRALLPAVRITTPSNQRENSQQAHDIGWFTGTLSLVVDVWCEDRSDPLVVERLDALCRLVEVALLASEEFRAIARVQVLSIDITTSTDVQGEMRTAVATMTFTLRYVDCIPRVWNDELRNVHIRLDFVDPPADPNTTSPPADVPGGYPGGWPGPDGRIEHELRIELDAGEAQAGTPPSR